MTYPDRQTAARMAECDERYRRATGMGVIAYSRHANRRIRSLLRHANLSTYGRVHTYGPSCGFTYPQWIDCHRRHESIIAGARMHSGYVLP